MSFTGCRERVGDPAEIAAILDEAIADRIATFETELRTAECGIMVLPSVPIPKSAALSYGQNQDTRCLFSAAR